MKLGSSRKPISLAMVPSARPRNGKTMLSALSQNATRPDRLPPHFLPLGEWRGHASATHSAGLRSRFNIIPADVLFGAHYGLKSDIVPCPLSARSGNPK